MVESPLHTRSTSTARSLPAPSNPACPTPPPARQRRLSGRRGAGGRALSCGPSLGLTRGLARGRRGARLYSVIATTRKRNLCLQVTNAPTARHEQHLPAIPENRGDCERHADSNSPKSWGRDEGNSGRRVSQRQRRPAHLVLLDAQATSNDLHRLGHALRARVLVDGHLAAVLLGHRHQCVWLQVEVLLRPDAALVRDCGGLRRGQSRRPRVRCSSCSWGERQVRAVRQFSPNVPSC